MTFCKIAEVFNDSPGSRRVPNFTLPSKLGMLSATHEGHYATPLRATTPSLGSSASRSYIAESSKLFSFLCAGYFLTTLCSTNFIQAQLFYKLLIITALAGKRIQIF